MDLKDRLVELARTMSDPFCGTCELEAREDNLCARCGKACAARLLSGVGYDCGTDWIIRHWLETNVPMIDVEVAFAAWVGDCYGETVEVAWVKLDVRKVLREMNFEAWEQGKREWLHAEESAGRLLTFDHAATYYSAEAISNWLAAANLSRTL